MYIYIYLYICTYIHTYMYHGPTYTYSRCMLMRQGTDREGIPQGALWAHKSPRPPLYVSVQPHACIIMLRILVCMLRLVFPCVFIKSAAYIRLCTFTCVLMPRATQCTCVFVLHLNFHVYVSIPAASICIRTFTCMDMHVYVCMFQTACIYFHALSYLPVCIYVCKYNIYIYIYIYIYTYII